MKDTEIHNGLSNNTVRDFLSSKMSRALFSRDTRKKVNAVVKNGDYIQHSIDECDASIQFYTERKMYNEIIKAISFLIKSNGWLEFDISNHVIRPNSGYHLNFIGTKDEYKEFMEKNKFKE
jgi:hypothetical protein